jgi:DNA-binding NarL/FixJ family response regulator
MSKIFSVPVGQNLRNNNRMISILLLDDHGVLREGIKRLLEVEPDLTVCGESSTVKEALAALRGLGPDILISDISLGEGNSFELIETLVRAGTGTKILVLSMHDNPAFVSRALSLGASGYVTKAAAAKELVTALRALMQGEAYISSDIRRMKSAVAPKLTQREHDALKLLVRGLPPKVIAAELGINDKTLYGHRANLMLKLQARNLSDLQEKAVSLGLIDKT